MTFYRQMLQTVGSKAANRRRIRNPSAPVVTGPREQVLMCQICMGRIKIGMNWTQCKCGNVYHPVCLERTGYCPQCKQIWGSEEVESHDQERTMNSCPVCRRELSIGQERCACGAVFVNDSGRFRCPVCDAILFEGEEVCPICGEAFERYETIICPRCGKMIAPGETACTCGLPVDSICPVCGRVLGPKDNLCPCCETEFVFV